MKPSSNWIDEVSCDPQGSLCKGLNVKSERRGRRVIYQLHDRRRLAELIRKHGARGTREVTGRAVSVSTLLKVAGEFGIELKKGRRPRTAA